MTDTHSYLLSDARKALKSHRLHSAIQSLKGMATLLKAWNEAEELYSISNSYNTLLDYFAQGSSDPERIRLYNNFICRIYEISDVLERLSELKNEDSFYTLSLHALQKNNGYNLSLTDYLISGTNHKDLFHAIWLSAQWKAEEEAAVKQILSDPEFDTDKKSLIISAMTLSSMKYFDIAKIRIFLQFASSQTTVIRARALTGLIFSLFFFSDRIALYPQITSQLQLMLETPDLAREIELIQTQLFLSLETKRIERNLQEEIIPHMMKRIEHLKLDRSLGLDDLKERLAEADLNPEWTNDDGKPSKVAKYIQEFVELQKRGADMYMGTFKMLKQRFPFFREISNWFYPFSLNHPEIPQTAQKNKTLNILLQSKGLCDSDKFSFCLIADQLRQSLPDETLQNLIADKNMSLPEEVSVNSEEDFKEHLRSYIQGFYRFSNLFIYNQQFPNPFQQDAFIANYAPFSTLLNDTSFVTRMADFTFRDNLYNIACPLFERIPSESRDASIWQKIGYCYERNHNIEKAIEYYACAHDMNSSDTWTLRRLATCLRSQGKYKEALHYYDSLANLYPENAYIAFRQGECHLHLQQYDEAFKGFYKADYLDDQSENTMRALAWCSILTHKYEQAEHYYRKILNSSPTPIDYLNAGHTAWLSGNLPLAITRYISALPQENPEHFLDDDIQTLLDNGITTDEINIMTDAVLFKYETQSHKPHIQ